MEKYHNFILSYTSTSLLAFLSSLVKSVELINEYLKNLWLFIVQDITHWVQLFIGVIIIHICVDKVRSKNTIGVSSEY